jgi:hypothetical protein
MFGRLFFSLCIIGCAGALCAQNKADSIIAELLRFRNRYGEYVREYEARVYIKGDAQVIRKNRLARYAPDFLYWDKASDRSFAEALVDLHYEAPNRFTQQIRAVNGDLPTANDIQDRLMQFLSINIYNPSIFNDRVVLPDLDNIFHYYRFEYVNALDTLGRTIHQIGIHPRRRSQKLISGHFYIADSTWTVFRLDVRGKWELFDYRIETQFGLQPGDFLLPRHSAVTFHMRVLGNEMESRYFSRFEYRSVRLDDSKARPAPLRYDLSNHFNIHSDTLPFVRDSSFWAVRRPFPLSPYEQSLLDRQAEAADSTLLRPATSWYFAKGLLAPASFRYNEAQFTYSGLINPLKLAYTKADGILYWQQFRISRNYGNGRAFRFQPSLGVLFQRKQVYFALPVSWLFAPARFGELSFHFGNRNRAYNSTIIRRITSAVPDSIRFSDLNLDYYRHYQSGLEARYEWTNGLMLYGKIHYDWYVPVRKGHPLSSDVGAGADVIQEVQNRYRSFVPSVGLRWTPGQFYRIDGHRKAYLYSHYPTFFVEYARGIRGVLNSNSHYERIEIDVQQKIPLGLNRSFHYYAGAGRFTNTRSVYFADFSHFQRRNIPLSWRDPIGGVFHVLDNDWYNAADAYAQLHLMYESPFAILQLFHRLTSDIVNERIYVSQLYTPARPCYTEIGYGIGNFIGNAGVFASFNRGRYQALGVRFALEWGM